MTFVALVVPAEGIELAVNPLHVVSVERVSPPESRLTLSDRRAYIVSMPLEELLAQLDRALAA